MSDTPERSAWLDGSAAGEMFGRMLRQGHTWGEAVKAAEPASRTPALFAAWLAGFGQGIGDAAGVIPGHHLASVWDATARTTRTELVTDRK